MMKLVIYVVVAFSSLFVISEAACGDVDRDWEVSPNFQLILPPVDVLVEVSDVKYCIDHCKNAEDFDCLSFEYSNSEEKCHFNDKKKDDSAETENTPGVTYYELTCADDDGDGLLSPREFFEWMRDEPALAALGGMGILIVMLTIVAICAICILSSDRKESEGLGDFMERA